MIDTKKIRETFSSYHIRTFGDQIITIGEMCDEIDRLRVEVARLREKCGEKVCRACGEPRVCLHEVHVDVRGRNAKDVFDHVCGKCIDRALDAIRGEK